MTLREAFSSPGLGGGHRHMTRHGGRLRKSAGCQQNCVNLGFDLLDCYRFHQFRGRGIGF